MIHSSLTVETRQYKPLKIVSQAQYDLGFNGLNIHIVLMEMFIIAVNVATLCQSIILKKQF